ncbi:hypothetical protein [Klebsiella phage pKP-BM327-1.1]|nr:hypothetical protein [Klebsiella phage pKP-BM327-1.1]DAL41194.1 MAG TPA_asm: hypothetical protein [Caudoviricetes sp.]
MPQVLKRSSAPVLSPCLVCVSCVYSFMCMLLCVYAFRF